LARAGEPFFTTKPTGSGMGLGLFLARSLVEKVGGRLAIASQPGRGTTVSVVLPCAPAAASPRAVAS
jgi:two-component system, sensor histidine kinase RegB